MKPGHWYHPEFFFYVRSALLSQLSVNLFERVEVSLQAHLDLSVSG